MKEKTVEILKDIKSGISLSEIARKHNISRQCVHNKKKYYLEDDGVKALENKEIFSNEGRLVKVRTCGIITMPKIARDKMGIKVGDELGLSLSFDGKGEPIIIIKRRKDGD